MSRLEELISKLCPDGVKYVKIKSTFRRLKGTPITATKMKEIENADGDITVFAGGKTVIRAKEEDIPNANVINVPSVLVQSRGVIDVIYCETPFTFKNEMWAYTFDETITVKFLYYILKNNIEEFRNIAKSMGSFPQISLPATEDYFIPLPPLPVQEEIVRILDNMTSLTAELTAELSLRQKQYEHYRDSLLSFEGKGEHGVRWMQLQDVADIGTGSSNTNEELEEGLYPFFVRSQQVRRKNSYEFDETAIITSGDGVGVGKIFHYIEGKYALHQRAYRIHINTLDIIPKYFYYYMKATFLPYIEKNSFHSSVTSIRRPMLNNFPVPVPSLEEQQCIIDILDRFEKLCNDIREGLPAEIEARKKQYEYYRDKLLTFKEKET